MNVLRSLLALTILLSPLAAMAQESPFRFAYRDAERAPHAVFLQSHSGSFGKLLSSCGVSGQRCACDFFDAEGHKLGTTSISQIALDTPAQYFFCGYSGDSRGLASVALRSRHSKWSSSRIPVRTSLSAAEILGPDLSLNYLRSVYSYSCELSFLQKFGTTTTTFDCSNQAAPCNGDNFCLLQTRLPFYLYADNFQSNFHAKMADQLYNGGGSGKICGLQISQYQCSGLRGTPVKEFGLYAQQTDSWNTSVHLGAAPNASVEFYGFAAQVSPTTNECPPGLVKRVFYRVNPIDNSPAPHSNFPVNLVASQVGDPGAVPAPLYINQIPGGHCNGTSCSMPASGVLTVSTQKYSSTGETIFCVLPPNLLP